MQPVLMPILKGGFIFAADLVRTLDPCPEGMVIEFVSARCAQQMPRQMGDAKHGLIIIYVGAHCSYAVAAAVLYVLQ